MYVCNSVERSVVKKRVQFQLYVWRVEMSPTGRPVWKLHRKGHWARGYSSEDQMIRMCRNTAEANVPFMQDAGPDKPVTMRQAEVLTGHLRPAALDYLTEHVNDSPTVSNYVKPAKVKRAEPARAPAPTKVDIARQKHLRALNKVTQWDEAILHAEVKRKEWRKKAHRLEQRLNRLEAEAAQTTTKGA